MRLPAWRQQTVARFSFKGSALPFHLRNDWQKPNFRLCHCGELWSTRHRDGKCQWNKPSRGEKIWSLPSRGIKQEEEDPYNPGAGGGFTFSSTLLSPLRWGVAAPVFGWHVSIIRAFHTHIMCDRTVTHVWLVCQVHVSQQARALAARCHSCPECCTRETLLWGKRGLLWDHSEILWSPCQWPADIWSFTFLLPCCWVHSPSFDLRR